MSVMTDQPMNFEHRALVGGQGDGTAAVELSARPLLSTQVTVMVNGESVAVDAARLVLAIFAVAQVRGLTLLPNSGANLRGTESKS